MRNLFVNSPWSVVRCHVILGTMLFGWLAAIHSCPAQEAPGQDKKPGAAPAKPATGATGATLQERMNKMMGEGKGGSTGGISQMMGQMGGQPAKPSQAAEPTLEEM